VLVSDVEISRLAGQLHRSGYTLRMLLKAIQYRRLAETYPSVAQQLQASLNYCYKVEPQTLPGISQLLSYVLGMTASAQTSPVVSQTAAVYRKTNVGITSPGSTSYPESYFGISTPGTGGTGANYLVHSRFQAPVNCTVKALETYGSASGNRKVGAYADSSGAPGAKLIPEQEDYATANTWDRVILNNRFYLTANSYVWLSENVSVTNAIGTGSGVSRLYKTWNYADAWPDPAGTGYSADTNKIDNYRAIYVQIKGYIKGTKVIPGWSGDKEIDKVYFYAHDTGNVRLAIYNNASPKQKLWESPSVAVTAGWNSVNISSGTPTTLTLTGGQTYWLCWQTDSVNDVPSYVAGSSGDGFYLAYIYGAYPSTISGETSSAEKWAMYVETAWF
jgi:hypothetical protein